MEALEGEQLIKDRLMNLRDLNNQYPFVSYKIYGPRIHDKLHIHIFSK